MWFQVMNTVIGIWLMAAPAVLHYGRPAATNDYIIGPLVATFACIAIWEATRPVRWINLLLGLWMIASPIFLGYPQAGAINCVVCGIGVAILACMGGAVRQRFAGGWSALWRGVPTQ